MFELELPWWEFVVRAVVVYGVLLVLVRLSGKRTVGQFTPFDLIVVVLLSESVSSALNGGDDSLGGGLISAATLVTLNYLMSLVTSHSKAAQRTVEGHEVVLGRNGRLYDDVLKRERVARAEVDEALREHDCTLEKMRCAILETDGRISILQH